MSAQNNQSSGEMLRKLRKAPRNSVVNDIAAREEFEAEARASQDGSDGHRAPVSEPAADPQPVTETPAISEPVAEPAAEPVAADPAPEPAVEDPVRDQPVAQAPRRTESFDGYVPPVKRDVPARFDSVRGRRQADAVPGSGVDEKRSKVTFYQSAADTARMKATHAFTLAYTGHENQTDFIEEAILRYIHHLEIAYNNGEPFPAAPIRRKR